MTYLSIDLDYFNKAPFDPWLLATAFSLGLPTTLCVDHHDILPHLDEISRQRMSAGLPPIDKVVNLDYHSDLLSAPEPLHCGNWVNFVPFRDSASYLWILPRLNDYHLRWGYCHVGENPFIDTRRLTGWLAADKQEGYFSDLFADVVAIGICVSPNYLDSFSDSQSAFAQFHALASQYQLPVIPSANPEYQAIYEQRLSETISG